MQMVTLSIVLFGEVFHSLHWDKDNFFACYQIRKVVGTHKSSTSERYLESYSETLGIMGCHNPWK